MKRHPKTALGAFAVLMFALVWSLSWTGSTSSDEPASTSFPRGDLIISSEAPFIEREYRALVIGIADYPGSLHDLDYCTDDAIRVKDLLVDNYFFDEANVDLLLDENASKLGIKNKFTELEQKSTDDDVIFMFYSGHGHADSINEYITPFDGLMNPKLADWELDGWIQDLSFSQFILVLDSCYSGGILENITSEHVLGLAACAKDELSYESDGFHQGVFTHFFIEALERSGDFYQHDTNLDGRLDLCSELFPFVNSSTIEYYRQYNLTVNPRLLEPATDMILDWRMQTTGVFYENNLRKMQFFFERNRTRPFNLTFQHFQAIYNQTTDTGTPATHETIVDVEQFPFATSLSFLDENQNHVIIINESIQNFSFYFEYDPFVEDGDGDGIVDGVEWDLRYLYDVTNGSDGILDHDGDGLDVYQECYVFFTDPLSADTDGDGLEDGNEINLGTNPLQPDTDGDWFGDGDEIKYGTNPNDPLDSLLTRTLLVIIIVSASTFCIVFIYKKKLILKSWIEKGKIQIRRRKEKV